MSVRLAAQRLVPSAGLVPSTTRATIVIRTLGTPNQRRYKWLDAISRPWKSLRGKNRGADDKDLGGPDLDDPAKRRAFLRKGLADKTEGNIFQDEIEGPEAETPEDDSGVSKVTKTPSNTALAVDPDPLSRVRWQRKKVIQMVKRNGRLTRDERIKMTERQLLHKSEFIPTSVKKLVMLSRQIAGKPLEDAITQMKWSKKKMAREMRYYLEEARDLAVTERGMGLGKVNGESLEQPRKIKTAEGKWMEVTDPTRMYVAESWVGRGPWRQKKIDYKGRGRMGIIQNPSTSFSVVLKEEKTRIRQYEEREAKKARKGPWVHLPNRNIVGQRPYYSW